MYYMVADYSATGEGRTISILITRAYPREEDWITFPKFEKDENGKYYKIEGVLKCTHEEIALREFTRTFDAWTAIGVEFLSKEDFIKKAGKYLSDLVIKTIDEPAGNFHYHSQFHINYS
jgi:hypothetical protein